MNTKDEERNHCGKIAIVAAERDQLLDKSIKLNEFLDRARLNRGLLIDILFLHEGPRVPKFQEHPRSEYSLSTMKRPYIVVGKLSLLAVFNFGTVSDDNPNFHRESILRPTNYKAKRLYYGDGGRGFAFYTCKLTTRKNLPFYSITTEDGRYFGGSRSIFHEFAKSLQFNRFKNIDDFFGLTEFGVQDILLRSKTIKKGNNEPKL